MIENKYQENKYYWENKFFRYLIKDSVLRDIQKIIKSLEEIIEKAENPKENAYYLLGCLKAQAHITKWNLENMQNYLKAALEKENLFE